MDRQRCYLVMLSGEMQWERPYEVLLRELCFRQPVENGSSYFRADPDLVQAHMARKAQARRMPLSRGPTAAPWRFKHVCCPGLILQTLLIPSRQATSSDASAMRQSRPIVCTRRLWERMGNACSGAAVDAQNSVSCL